MKLTDLTGLSVSSAFNEISLKQLGNVSHPSSWNTSSWGRDILAGEFNLQLRIWNCRASFSPSKYVKNDNTVDYTVIYKDVVEYIDKYSSEPPTEKKEIARQLARFVKDESLLFAERLKKSKRIFISPILRQKLVDSYSEAVRCRACGFRFSDSTVESFLSVEKPLRTKQLLLHLHKDRGSSSRDNSIEIDHKIPRSLGGEDKLENLEILCGWCNSAKSNNQFFLGRDPFKYYKDSTGKLVLRMSKFFSYRVTSLSNRCEHPLCSCGKTKENSEFFPSLQNKEGEPNPLNVRTLCQEHLPDEEMVSSNYLEGLKSVF